MLIICIVGTSSAYCEMEQLVFNSLTTLIKDTGVLRDYAGLSLLLVQVRTGREADCCPQVPNGHPLARREADIPRGKPRNPVAPMCLAVPEGGAMSP